MGDLEKFVQEIPELAPLVRLYDTVRGNTFAELAAREQAPVDAAGIAALRAAGADGARRLQQLLQHRLLRRPDDLHRLVFEHLEDAAARGQPRSLLWWPPTALERDAGIPYPAALAAMVRAVRDARAACGVDGRLLPAIDPADGPAAALALVDEVLTHRADEVAGIGVIAADGDVATARDKARAGGLAVFRLP